MKLGQMGQTDQNSPSVKHSTSLFINVIIYILVIIFKTLVLYKKMDQKVDAVQPTWPNSY